MWRVSDQVQPLLRHGGCMAGEAITLRMEPTIVIFLNGHIMKLLLILRVSQLCLEKLFFEQALAGNSRSWTVEGHRTCP